MCHCRTWRCFAIGCSSGHDESTSTTCNQPAGVAGSQRRTRQSEETPPSLSRHAGAPGLGVPGAGAGAAGYRWSELASPGCRCVGGDGRGNAPIQQPTDPLPPARLTLYEPESSGTAGTTVTTPPHPDPQQVTGMAMNDRWVVWMETTRDGIDVEPVDPIWLRPGQRQVKRIGQLAQARAGGNRHRHPDSQAPTLAGGPRVLGTGRWRAERRARRRLRVCHRGLRTQADTQPGRPIQRPRAHEPVRHRDRSLSGSHRLTRRRWSSNAGRHRHPREHERRDRSGSAPDEEPGGLGRVEAPRSHGSWPGTRRPW